MKITFFNINKRSNFLGRKSPYWWYKMGDDPKFSVINSDLKVHHTKNLFVIGSSIFSKSGHANLTFSIVQFSARLGEYFQKY